VKWNGIVTGEIVPRQGINYFHVEEKGKKKRGKGQDERGDWRLFSSGQPENELGW